MNANFARAAGGLASYVPQSENIVTRLPLTRCDHAA